MSRDPQAPDDASAPQAMTAMNLPGSPVIPAALADRLQEALAGKGGDYQPRTHHRDGHRPRFTNRLILETSPYLGQHAHNPVNWYPWGDEAFADARRLGVPVFLSVGYSTCHWCHVMERESFEDEEIAAYLNRNFISIKVDREERPDIDAIYMNAVQNLTGSGGWPMSVWLDADRQPFFAGTYFPPRDGARGPRQGFLTVLQSLKQTWDREPDRVRKVAASLTDAVRENLQGRAVGAAATMPLPTAAAVDAAVTAIKSVFDQNFGGLRRAPKFPSNLPVRLLLRHHLRTGDAESLRMATLTLDRMATGGLHDQVGGGFHRYSTDAQWLVPHFEKMLYDNALLVMAYAEAFQVTGNPDYGRVCRTTLDYILREMTAPEGGFYSATDADSEDQHGHSAEGRFFVWDADEIRDLLGEDAERFARYYGVTKEGNFEGHNILFVPNPDPDEWSALAPARATLYQARAARKPPARDEKILAAWNGLMISALAVAGRVLDEPRYVQAAARAADFVLNHMMLDGRILRSFKDGRVQPVGFAEDQAFMVQGLLDLHEASLNPLWLAHAQMVADRMEFLFASVKGGGWYTTASDGETLLAREKPEYDGAEPSATSIAILNALRIHAFTGDDRWRRIADRALAAIAVILTGRGMAMTEGLLALEYRLGSPREIVLVWPPGAGQDSARPLLDILRRTFVPHRVMTGAEQGAAIEALATHAPIAADKVCVDGKPTVYLCRDGRCESPVTDPDELLAQLRPVSG